MKRERDGLDSSLTLLSRDDPEMDLHGYRGTTRCSGTVQAKISPRDVRTPLHFCH